MPSYWFFYHRKYHLLYYLKHVTMQILECVQNVLVSPSFLCNVGFLPKSVIGTQVSYDGICMYNSLFKLLYSHLMFLAKDTRAVYDVNTTFVLNRIRMEFKPTIIVNKKEKILIWCHIRTIPRKALFLCH